MAEIHRRNKIGKKTSVQSDNKLKSKVKFNYSNRNYEEVGSLAFLMDSKDKQKINELDARMKHLKSELKLLFNEENMEDKSLAGCENDTKTCNLLLCTSKDQKPLMLDSEIKVDKICDKGVNPSELKVIPASTFSDWLDKTIDEIDITSQKNSSPCSNSQLNVQSKKLSLFDKSSAKSSSMSKFINASTVSQSTIEELLYKTLYLQILGINLCSSELNASNQIKSDRKLKQTQVKRKKSSKKKDKEKFDHSNLFKYCKPSKIRRKRKKTFYGNPFESSVEIIDLDHNLETPNCAINDLKTSEECFDLDLTKYDWNEPFNLEDKEESSSDVEIIEDSCEENSEFDKEELKINHTFLNNNSSVNNGNSDKGQSASGGWECPICFEQSKGQEVVATLCGHIFCKICLQNYYLKYCKKCPTCRTDLTNKKPIPLFNF